MKSTNLTTSRISISPSWLKSAASSEPGPRSDCPKIWATVATISKTLIVIVSSTLSLIQPYGSLLGFKLLLVAWVTYLIWFKKRSKNYFSEETMTKNQMLKDFFSRDRLLVILGIAIIYLSETLANLQNL